MKKSILIVAVVMFSGMFTMANAGKGASDNRSIEQTRKLSQNLLLNESAFIKVKHLSDLKFHELDKAASLYANDGALKQLKIAEIENTFNTQVEAILSASQKVAFQNYLNQNNANIAIAK